MNSITATSFRCKNCRVMIKVPTRDELSAQIEDLSREFNQLVEVVAKHRCKCGEPYSTAYRNKPTKSQLVVVE